MHPLPKSWWIRTAPLWLLALSLLVAAGLTELILRLYPRLLPEQAQLRVLWQHGRDDVITVADPYFGVRMRPLQRARVQTQDFDIIVTTDERGFRNPSPWPSRADIVVVGDSLAYGYGVDLPKTWVTLLAAARPDEPVINLGIPGMGPRQYTRYFEKLGLPLRPRVLLYSVFPANDLKDAEHFAGWLAAGSPGHFSEWRWSGGDESGWTQWWLDNSYLAIGLRSIRHYVRNVLRQSENRSRTLELSGGARVQVVPEMAADAAAKMQPGNPGFDSMIDAIRDAQELATRNGVRMVCVIFPSKSRIYLPLSGQEFLGPSELLSTYLRKEGFEVLDLTDALRAEAARGEQVYFEVDIHPNELGNRIIADAVNRHLESPANSPVHEPGPARPGLKSPAATEDSARQ